MTEPKRGALDLGDLEGLSWSFAQKRALLAYAKSLRTELHWALDLLDMYDERMVELGDPKEKVYSLVHTNRKSKARGLLP